MLKKINSIISKNTEIFQKITDEQAAFISGGMEIPVAPDIPSIPYDVGELTPQIPNLPNLPVDLLNSVPTTFPLDMSSFGVPVTV
ncbi:MAG: hypothetical protein RLZZ507_2965 [Cyanobacteriota bacterium]|jgi:hypothetical protein